MRTKEFEKNVAKLFIEHYDPKNVYFIDEEWVDNHPYEPVDIKFKLNGETILYPQLQIRRITFRLGEQKAQLKLFDYLEKGLNNYGVRDLRVNVYIKKGIMSINKKKLLAEIIKCIQRGEPLEIETNECLIKLKKYHKLAVICSSANFMPVDEMIVKAIGEKERKYPGKVKSEMALLLVDKDLICDKYDIEDFLRKNRISRHGFKEIFLLYSNGEKLLKIK